MGTIRSGRGTDTMTVGATSKAARGAPYNSDGVRISARNTYMASTLTTFTTPNNSTPFISISGVSGRIVRVLVIKLQLTNGGVANISAVLNVTRRSSLSTGGGAGVLVPVPLDSNSPQSSMRILNYAVAPTTLGQLVGLIFTTNVMIRITPGTAIPTQQVVFDWRDPSALIHEPPTLRGPNQTIEVSQGSSPGATCPCICSLLWTEE